jgi:hypothetical protein
MNPHSYTHLIFDKGTKNIQWRKDSLFNECCWENYACRKLKVDPFLSPCLSINSKWIKDPDITLKLVQEGAGLLELVGIGNDFLNRTQMAQQLRERIHKYDYMN